MKDPVTKLRIPASFQDERSWLRELGRQFIACGSNFAEVVDDEDRVIATIGHERSRPTPT